jgi:hypothetical protein
MLASHAYANGNSVVATDNFLGIYFRTRYGSVSELK